MARGYGSSAICFNPRTRVGCDRFMRQGRHWPHGFQSTHPRGVRHIVNPLLLANREVSIHAPAWGATTVANDSPFRLMFQSTHPRGVRRPSFPRLRPLVQCFNPRTRVGCDNQLREAFALQRFVSIHAPAWGATIDAFIPSGPPVMFQSTHPRGVRRRCAGRGRRLDAVSIHAPAWGATFPLPPSSGASSVSIHAPAWGATLLVMDCAE